MNVPDYYCHLVKTNLRRLKKEKGWTTEELSRQTGIRVGYLNSLLSLAMKKKVPTIYMLGVICEAVDVEIEYFFKEITEDETLA